MWLTSEDVITTLSSEELSHRVSKFEAIETNDREYLMKHLKKLERTRHLSLWHDHSAVLSRGYILSLLVSYLMKQFSMSVCMMKENMVLNSKNMSSNLKYI